MYKRLLSLLFCMAIFYFLIPGSVVKADTNGDFVVRDGVLVEYRGSSANLVIPGNLGITKIGDHVFSYKDFIITVTIPDSITSIGDFAFDNCSNLTSVEIGNGVTSIGKWAFYKCTGLKNLIIGNNVTEIGVSAFEQCINLTNVIIPDSVNIIGQAAFDSCKGLASVNIPDSVTVLQKLAFQNCENLTNVTIGKGVTFIGEKAFYSCPKLTRIDVNSENKIYYSIDGILYYKEHEGMLYDKSMEYIVCYPAGRADTVFTIPDNVAAIDSYAFAKANNLREIIIPDSVLVIYEGAFLGCHNLQSITIPYSVYWIEGRVFEECRNLTNVTIPSSVIHLGNSVFVNCESLKSIIIPNSVTFLGENAFLGCKGLTDVTISKGIVKIFDNTFSNCTSLKSITIPNSVTELMEGAFSNCSSITSIDIPNSVTKIGSRVFEGCTSLTSINISGNVMDIGDFAFYNCTSLRSVSIPDYLSTIGQSMFNSCTSLTNITIPKRVTNIDSQAFYNCRSLTEAKFLGNAPAMGSEVFNLSSSNFKILYPIDKTGYSNPWHGYSAQSFRLGAYTVTYDGNGNTAGTVPVDISTYLEGDEIQVRQNTGSLAKTGFSFAGWNTKHDGSGITYGADGFENSLSMGPGNVTLYAKWANNSYNKFQYSISDNKATITGYTGTGGNLTIPSEIDGYTVTAISDYAFFSSSNLTGVIIPYGVKSIGRSAFNLCTSLTSVTIPYSVTSIGEAAFFNCSSLVSLSIPDSVKSIGNFAFSGCKSLTDVTLSYNITAMSDYMFSNCSSLKNVTIPSGVTQIGRSVFLSCTSLTNAAIPNKVTKIGDGAFTGCTSLTGITIPDSVTSLGKGAFDSCTSLISVTIPNGVTSLGYKTFNSCTSLLSVRLSNRLTSIGNNVFDNCTNLRTVTIPNSVKSIGDKSFEDCSSLTSIIIPNSVTNIGYRAFGDCSSLRSVNIPDSVTSLGNSVFSHCSSLTSVTIPGNLTVIGDYMFEYCFNLISVTIPKSVESIGASSFLECGSLTSVTIPENVESIGHYAFQYCSSLTEAKFLGNAPDLGDRVFDDSAYNFKIYYLDGKTGFTNPWYGYTTAKFNPQSYNVTYDGNGNTAGTVPIDSNTYLQGDTVTVLGNTGALTKTGFVFGGWNTRADGSGTNYNSSSSGNTLIMGASNIILYAKWAASSNADFRYTLSGNNAIITGYSGNGGDIIVPASIDGYTVTGIGDRAFYYSSTITSATIPDSVTSIGNFAFASCSNLTTVSIPNSVTSLGSNVFNSCSRLTSVTLPEGITSIGDALFYYCSSLSSVTIPDSVTSIGIYAFGNCISLESVTIPESVTYISFNAFRNSGSLKEAKFLGNAPEMGDYVFDGCADGFKVYYLEGKTGFTNPWYGYPTQLMNAQPLTVTFDSNGGSAVPIQTVGYNAYAVKPTDPIKAGYTFGGWYSDNNTFTNSFNFNSTPITANITLFAKWIPAKVLDSIVITAPPKKTVYVIGESLDLTGLVVTGYYNDGTTSVINVTGDNISGFDSSKLVQGQIITVTVAGKTAAFTVNVIAKTEIIISVNCRGGAYNKSQSIVLTASEACTIYYTTDGSDPTEKSRKYTTSIKISTSTILKFIAVDKYGYKSKVFMENYIIDTTAPKVKAIAPSNGFKNVPFDQNITLEFTEEIQLGSGTISLADSKRNNVPLNIEFQQENKMLLKIVPLISLKPSEKYTLTITKDGVKDLVGNGVSSTYSSSFYTIIMPVVSSSTPADKAVRVRMNSSITVKFNVKVYPGDSVNAIKLEYIKNNERKQVEITSTFSNTTLTIKPKTELRGDMTFYLTIPKAAVKDTAAGPGKTMVEDKLIQFTTEAETAFKTISNALAKLPSDDTAALKFKIRTTLQGYLDAVNKAIAAAKTKGIADSEIEVLPYYGRIIVAQKRIDFLKTEEDAAAKAKAISAVAAALKKLPADDTAAAKMKTRKTLQGYLDAVNKAISAAKEKGATDSDIVTLADYGRILVAQKRIDALKAEEVAAAKEKAIKAVVTALRKLPADDAAAAKIKSIKTLQGYLDAVDKSIEEAKEKGATDSEIESLSDYGRIAVALKRIDELD